MLSAMSLNTGHTCLPATANFGILISTMAEYLALLLESIQQTMWCILAALPFLKNLGRARFASNLWVRVL